MTLRRSPGRLFLPDRWYRRMGPRDTDEPHRASTPLELLFDLCFVVGVAQAGGRLHHALSADEIGHGVGSYLMVFFAIWWAWLNFTWFASAYDVDDGLYRVTTFVQITGALILAAGVPRAFDRNDFGLVVVGYVVMRLAMVAQWLRAAWSDPSHRTTALRFAVGVTLVQVGWVGRVWTPRGWSVATFGFLVICEIIVPIYAEHAHGTTWHREHIAERYGLFTLIVLGESILASTSAIQVAFDAGGHRGTLLGLCAGGLVIAFAMWWLYFERPSHEVLTMTSGFVWGYGHYFIFGATAALGAGVAVNIDALRGESSLSARSAAWTIAVPVAVFLMGVWLLLRRPGQPLARTVAFPIAAVLVLAAPLGPAPVIVIAVIMAALVAITSWR
jgi:low temperature requirement protein LtrA